MEKNELFFTECVHAVLCLCLWNASHSPFVNHLFYVNRSLVFIKERALVILVEWVNYETSSDFVMVVCDENEFHQNYAMFLLSSFPKGNLIHGNGGSKLLPSGILSQSC